MKRIWKELAVAVELVKNIVGIFLFLAIALVIAGIMEITPWLCLIGLGVIIALGVARTSPRK